MLVKGWRARLDRHAVDERCRARRDRTGPVLEFHQARPAGSRGRQAFIVAERWHADPETLERIENGCTVLNVAAGAIDHDMEHVVSLSNSGSR